FGTVGGGAGNTASGIYSIVVGGLNNTVGGQYATVTGGLNNTASGNYSVAAGQQAQANHIGSFVWNDSTKAHDNTTFFASTGINQFLIHATGGVGINTNNPAGNALNVAGTAQMTGLKMITGASAGAILTSDATGVGSWKLPQSVIGSIFSDPTKATASD